MRGTVALVGWLPMREKNAQLLLLRPHDDTRLELNASWARVSREAGISVEREKGKKDLISRLLAKDKERRLRELTENNLRVLSRVTPRSPCSIMVRKTGKSKETRQSPWAAKIPLSRILPYCRMSLPFFAVVARRVIKDLVAVGGSHVLYCPSHLFLVESNTLINVCSSPVRSHVNDHVRNIRRSSLFLLALAVYSGAIRCSGLLWRGKCRCNPCCKDQAALYHCFVSPSARYHQLLEKFDEAVKFSDAINEKKNIKLAFWAQQLIVGDERVNVINENRWHKLELSDDYYDKSRVLDNYDKSRLLNDVMRRPQKAFDDAIDELRMADSNKAATESSQAGAEESSKVAASNIFKDRTRQIEDYTSTDNEVRLAVEARCPLIPSAWKMPSRHGLLLESVRGDAPGLIPIKDAYQLVNKIGWHRFEAQLRSQLQRNQFLCCDEQIAVCAANDSSPLKDAKAVIVGSRPKACNGEKAKQETDYYLAALKERILIKA